MPFHTRDLLARQRAQTINAPRGHPVKFGVVASQGPAEVTRLVAVMKQVESGLSDPVRKPRLVLLRQITSLGDQITALDKGLAREVRNEEDAIRMMTISEVGPVTATAFQAPVP